MAVNYFTFNGTSSTAFNIRVEKWPSMNAPTRIVEKIEVPGRSGDLTMDTGAYSNVTMEYSVNFNTMQDGFFETVRGVMNWLLGSHGYCRLEDSYDPDIYRMALLADQDEFVDYLNIFASTKIRFDCKPQKWLKSGETEVTLTSGNAVTNNYMPCYPLFKVTGNGTMTVGTNALVISNNSGQTMTIDCETMNCYTGTTNRNADVTVSGDFPRLENGSNTITFTNTTVKMTPRYWSL